MNNSRLSLPSDIAAAKTFTLFFGQIVLAVERNRTDSFRVKYRLWQTLSGLGLKGHTQQTLSEFLLKKRSKLPLLDIDAPHLQQVFQACYDVLCNEFGPVHADRMVNDVLQLVDGSPAGKASPLRNWL